ncbi:hypothetical protein [Pseudobacteroides cellulosolvens]|uniref:Uncharacterized protein n=1 Tax=Pseudobacteroides cellulosolvens ATCC 35603 = DSM 2933 TaxID=398512 RepID=A0A0L6JM11_9FIRM|nr:hypothetical protein [Pseudobacteroides cellulosolvens]KNY26809.1 hypothetical protein Bccel_2074 [Pseudobacteroides cellulosolvens ATCC 35603 = DSM 2933]
MSRNSDEQKFKGILRSVKYRNKCYIQEMAKALLLRYGLARLYNKRLLLKSCR